MKENRIIAIGDIHGHSLALRQLIEILQLTMQDTVITLGDYVNRGPDSHGVLEMLLKLQEQCQLIPLLGNHEEMMLDSQSDGYAMDRWRSQGGTETLRSYGTNLSLDNIPSTHWEFLGMCRFSYETDRYLFVHANYCWYSPLDQQPASLLRWTSVEEENPRPHVSGKTVILGHSPGSIRDLGFCRCIDTGCGFGGLLTAMEIQTRHCWQVNESGEPQMSRCENGQSP